MAFDFEKIGIYLGVVAVGYFVWRWALPYVFSGLGRAMGAHKMVPLPSADLRDDPRALAALRAGSGSAAAAAARGGFDRPSVVAVGGDWEEAARLNAVLAGLTTQRQPRVAREGALRGRVAWKVAVFRQAALYRLVALAAGSAADWNARNVLGAALLARGVLEAAALLADFDRRLQALVGGGDLAGIDALVTERGFASPLDGPAGPASRQGFEPSLIEAGEARAHYDALSGLADAAALGQYRVFGELEKAGTAVTFAAEAGFERGLFGHVLGGIAALAAAETALRGIEEKLPAVAALEAA
jgi:hypothetical protein